MNAEDVIIAPASPPAHGAADRAVVRLSGARLDEALRSAEIDAPPSPPESGKPIALASSMALAPGVRLPILLIRSFAPHSYTGEHGAELLLPGNPLLVARALARLCAAPGARPAEPGEFTARAFLNGRISAEQAEGVALAIAARTEEQLAAADSLLSGEAGARFRRWMDEAATLLALVEAGIDFTDQEDVQAIAPASLAQRLRALIGAIERDLGGAAPREAGAEAIRAVLIGEPNAGKSALFNALLGRPRAVVSPVHGATRDAIEEPLPPCSTFDALTHPPVTLVDLAGLDESLAARSRADHASQRAAAHAIARADVLILCDPSGRFEIESHAALRALAGAPQPTLRPTLRVRTKADLAAGVVIQNPSPLGGEDVPTRSGQERGRSAADLAACALDGRGVAPLRRAIFDAAAGLASPARAGAPFVLPRHARALRGALDSLGGALALVPGPEGGVLQRHELVAQRLRSALDALGEIGGRISPDDVLGRIFASFCIGK